MWLAVHGGPSFDLLTMDTVGWGRAGTAVPQGAVSELPNLPFFSLASIPKAIAQPSVRRPLSGLPPSSPSSSRPRLPFTIVISTASAFFPKSPRPLGLVFDDCPKSCRFRARSHFSSPLILAILFGSLVLLIKLIRPRKPRCLRRASSVEAWWDFVAQHTTRPFELYVRGRARRLSG